jgi:hypothetical protein
VYFRYIGTENSDESDSSIHREEENVSKRTIQILLSPYQFARLLFPENYNFINREISLVYPCISQGAIDAGLLARSQ